MQARNLQSPYSQGVTQPFAVVPSSTWYVHEQPTPMLERPVNHSRDMTFIATSRVRFSHVCGIPAGYWTKAQHRNQSAEATDERRASRVSELAPKIEIGSSRRKTTRDRKLRARRIRVTELALDELTAHATHSSLGRFQGRVDDLSLHGMRIFTKSNHETGLVLSGDRL